MRINKLVITLFCLVTILANLSINLLYAQNETGTRPFNKVSSQMRGTYYDSTVSMFQLKFPIIRSIPPLSSDMPLQVFASYVVIDSLCRTVKTREARDMIFSWKSFNDTLKNAVQFLYKAVDYNPVIFTQYADETEMNSYQDTGGIKMVMRPNDPVKDSLLRSSQSNGVPKVAGRYRASLPRLRSDIEERFRILLSAPNNKMGLYSLLISDHIFKVKILSIESVNNKLSSSHKRYRVLAKVLDNIKGKKYKTVSPLTSLNISDSSEIIEFQYTSNAYGLIDRVYSRDEYYPNAVRDPALSLDGNFMLNVDQEAIVFLTYGNHFLDDKNDYFDLDLEVRASLNALPLIDGNVRDINHIWSNNNLLSYNDWRNNVNNLINQILNNNY